MLLVGGEQPRPGQGERSRTMYPSSHYTNGRPEQGGHCCQLWDILAAVMSSFSVSWGWRNGEMWEQPCVKERRRKLAGTGIHAEPLHGCPIIYSDASTLIP